ncbi:MAG TPA: YHYH protein, partial [Candidatus Saccharimonadales bacterium]|nr:YHYH protein [Candidatus Saccharimonadales bacterium]
MTVAALLVTGCGGPSAMTSASAGSQRYATTPTSSGAVNPRAVPLGDGYVSTTPKVGYVDSCTTHFGGIGGAQVNGPWINTSAKTWNYVTKLAVNGRIRWPTGSYSVKIVDGRRVIKFNDLPIDHTTGVFPIASTDPAFKYDHNGNHIATQSFDWSLPLHPTAARTRGCTGGGPSGVLNDGIVLYNALDGEGRDAGAHEVLDLCAGHPDPSNTYHHHDIPPCILRKVKNRATTRVGYALDGYGIYVVKSANGTLPT